MAGFKADAQLAAMTQRAHEVLKGKNLAGGVGGVTVPNAVKPTPPTAVLQQMAAAMRARSQQGLQGLTQRFSGAQDILKINKFPAARALAMARGRIAAGPDKQWNPSTFSMDDFVRGNTGWRSRFGYKMSDEQILAAARNYAKGRSYNGVPYIPHNIAAEGDVQMINGVPHVLIKYSTPGYGSSTEWTPIK